MEDWAVDFIAMNDDIVLCGNVDDLLKERFLEHRTSRVVGIVDDDQLGVGLDEALQVFH